MKAMLIATSLVLSSAYVHAQAKNSEAQPAERATVVLNKLHAANQLEIAAGKLAQQQTPTPGIKKFGAQLIEDHTRADAALTALAKQKGVKLEAADKSKLDSLRDLKGAKFDRAFALMMSDDHKAAVRLVEALKDEPLDNEVRAFLNKTLPVLQEHLEHAQQLENPLPHTP